MARPCSVCTHPKIDEINRKLLMGETPGELAKVYDDLSGQSLFRHYENHVSNQIARAQAVNELAAGSVMLGDIGYYEGEARRLKDKAENEGDLKTALLAIDKALKCIELQAKVEGIVKEHSSINIFLSDEWRQVGIVLLQALEDFPEARKRAAMALMQIEKDKTGRVMPPQIMIGGN